MGEAYRTHATDEKGMQLYLEVLKEGEHMGELDKDGSILLES